MERQWKEYDWYCPNSELRNENPKRNSKLTRIERQ
jgi:hypothetical protein